MTEPLLEFEQLSEQYGQAIYRFFMIRTGNISLSEDLTQETFCKAWRSWPPSQSGSLKSWLFAIAANLFRDHLRHQKVVSRHQNELKEQIHLHKEPEAHDQVQAIQIREILNRLDSENREILTLKEMDGFTLDQIAEHLGLSRDRVRYRLKKAREKFIRLYNKSG